MSNIYQDEPPKGLSKEEIERRIALLEKENDKKKHNGTSPVKRRL